MVGPRGCDSPDGDINNGYTVVNCATSAAQVYANQQTTANQWWAPFYGENLCFALRGTSSRAWAKCTSFVRT